METTGAYLQRKAREIRLLEECLAAPRDLPPPRSVDDVVERKFRLGAALKAERALADWSLTETRWSADDARIGPYEIRYGYQRADLAIGGPSPYALGAMDIAGGPVIYTSCGMAAISAVAAALGRVRGAIGVLPGCYRETLEAVALCAPDLRVLRLDAPRTPGHSPSVLLVDSYVEGEICRRDLVAPARLDLVVFDTTCLAATSGRIRRVLAWAASAGLPSVLVRSHTKLDSLGIEYGRLGSAVFVVPRHVTPTRRALAENLAQGTQDAVRLFGSAAVPAHLPPFAGTPAYRDASARRVAAIMRNTRRLAARIVRMLPAEAQVKRFRHGLYLTVGPSDPWEPEEARHEACALTDRLRARGLPVRRAGSFGFDFVAAEEFVDARTERNVIRLSPADIPGALVDEIADEMAAWWRGDVKRRRPRAA